MASNAITLPPPNVSKLVWSSITNKNVRRTRVTASLPIAGFRRTVEHKKEKIMSNSFVITNCAYDGTSGDLNPLVGIVGTVSGKGVYPLVFFRYLDAANAAGQMQAALTAVMFNWFTFVYGYQQSPWPTPVSFPIFSPSNAVAQHTQGPFPKPPVVYSPALIGSWTA